MICDRGTVLALVGSARLSVLRPRSTTTIVGCSCSEIGWTRERCRWIYRLVPGWHGCSLTGAVAYVPVS